MSNELDQELAKADLRLKEEQTLQAQRDGLRFWVGVVSSILLPAAIASLAWVQHSTTIRQLDVQKNTEYQLNIIQIAWNDVLSDSDHRKSAAIRMLNGIVGGLPVEQQKIIISMLAIIADDQNQPTETRNQAAASLVNNLSMLKGFDIQVWFLSSDKASEDKAKKTLSLLKPELGDKVKLLPKSESAFQTKFEYPAEIRYSADEAQAAEVLQQLLNRNDPNADIRKRMIGSSPGILSVMFVPSRMVVSK